MKSAHTPGPWYRHTKNGQMGVGAGAVDKFGEPAVCVVGGCGCCGSPFGADDDAEAEANARMIAAAPPSLPSVFGWRAETMAIEQIEYTLRLRLWDLNRHTDPDWHARELERIAGMVAEGCTSGEIVGDRDETGWWELEHSETTSRSRAA